jgi:hypothetical protein
MDRDLGKCYGSKQVRICNTASSGLIRGKLGLSTGYHTERHTVPFRSPISRKFLLSAESSDFPQKVLTFRSKFPFFSQITQPNKKNSKLFSGL